MILTQPTPLSFFFPHFLFLFLYPFCKEGKSSFQPPNQPTNPASQSSTAMSTTSMFILRPYVSLHLSLSCLACLWSSSWTILPLLCAAALASTFNVLLHFLLDQRDQGGAPTLELGRGPRLDKPVKPERWGVSDLTPEPFVAILRLKPEPVQRADQIPVLFLGKVLALVGTVLDPELLEWLPVLVHLDLQRLLHFGTPDNLLLTLLDGQHDRVKVFNLGELGDKGSVVLGHFFRGLVGDFFRDRVHVVPTKTFASTAKLLKVTLVPRLEALLQQHVPLGHLFLAQRDRNVYLLLVDSALGLLLRRPALLRISPANLVVNLVPVPH